MYCTIGGLRDRRCRVQWSRFHYYAFTSNTSQIGQHSELPHFDVPHL
jgi:hypothetical protein